MKTHCQSYGRSCYTNSVDPFGRGEKKGQEIGYRSKTTKTSELNAIYLSLGVPDKVSLYLWHCENSVGERISEGVPLPAPTRNWFIIHFTPIQAQQSWRVANKLSDQTEGNCPFLMITSQRSSQPSRKKSKVTELIHIAKSKNLIYDPKCNNNKNNNNNRQWKNYLSNCPNL